MLSGHSIRHGGAAWNSNNNYGGLRQPEAKARLYLDDSRVSLVRFHEPIECQRLVEEAAL